MTTDEYLKIYEEQGPEEADRKLREQFVDTEPSPFVSGTLEPVSPSPKPVREPSAGFDLSAPTFPFREPEVPQTAQERPGYLSQLLNDVDRGTDLLQAMGGGAVAAAGDLLGEPGITQSGIDIWNSNMEEVKQNPALIGSFTNIKSVDDGFRYLIEAFGENALMMVPGIVSGGATGIVANRVLRAGAEKAIEGLMLRGLSKEAATKAVTAGVARKVAAAQAVGAYPTSAALETGGIAGEMYEQTGEVDGALALKGGSVSGALDTIPTLAALRMAAGKPVAEQVYKSFRRVLGENVTKEFFTEAPTELLQEVINAATVAEKTGEDIFTEEKIVGYLDAFLKGGLGSVPISAAATTIGRMRGNTQNADDAFRETGTRTPPVVPPAAPAGAPAPTLDDALAALSGTEQEQQQSAQEQYEEREGKTIALQPSATANTFEEMDDKTLDAIEAEANRRIEGTIDPAEIKQSEVMLAAVQAEKQRRATPKKAAAIKLPPTPDYASATAEQLDGAEREAIRMANDAAVKFSQTNDDNDRRMAEWAQQQLELARAEKQRRAAVAQTPEKSTQISDKTQPPQDGQTAKSAGSYPVDAGSTPAPATPVAETREQISERLRKQEGEKDAASEEESQRLRLARTNEILDELLGLDPESNDSVELSVSEKEQRLTPQQRKEYGNRILADTALPANLLPGAQPGEVPNDTETAVVTEGQAAPAGPTISENPATSELVGAEPAVVVEQEPVAQAPKRIKIYEAKGVPGKPGKYKTEVSEVDYDSLKEGTPFDVAGDDAASTFPNLQEAANMAKFAEESFNQSARSVFFGSKELPASSVPSEILVGAKPKSKKTPKPEFTRGSITKVKYGDFELQPPVSDFASRSIVIEDLDGEMRSSAFGNRTGAGGVIAKGEMETSPLLQTQTIKAGTARRIYVFDRDAVYGNAFKVYDIAPSKIAEAGAIDITPAAPTPVTTPPVAEAVTPAAQPDLTPEQNAALAEAQAQYDNEVQFHKRQKERGVIDQQMLGKNLKAAGMRFAAEKRKITGQLTDKEAAAKEKREAGNYIGKLVEVDGKPGKVVGNPFGRVRVTLDDDGSTITTTPDKVMPRSTAPVVQPEPPAAETPAAQEDQTEAAPAAAEYDGTYHLSRIDDQINKLTTERDNYDQEYTLLTTGRANLGKKPLSSKRTEPLRRKSKATQKKIDSLVNLREGVSKGTKKSIGRAVKLFGTKETPSDPPRRGNAANFGNSEWDNDPVVRYIIDNIGGIMSKSDWLASGRQIRGGEYDDAPVLKGRRNNIYKPGSTVPADEAATMLAEAGLIEDGTASSLWRYIEELQRVIDNRDKSMPRTMDEYYARLEQEDKDETKKMASEPVQKIKASDLQEGERFFLVRDGKNKLFTATNVDDSFTEEVTITAEDQTEETFGLGDEIEVRRKAPRKPISTAPVRIERTAEPEPEPEEQRDTQEQTDEQEEQLSPEESEVFDFFSPLEEMVNELTLDVETSRARARSVARKLRRSEVIDDRDLQEVERVLADKGLSREDAVEEAAGILSTRTDEARTERMQAAQEKAKARQASASAEAPSVPPIQKRINPSPGPTRTLIDAETGEVRNMTQAEYEAAGFQEAPDVPLRSLPNAFPGIRNAKTVKEVEQAKKEYTKDKGSWNDTVREEAEAVAAQRIEELKAAKAPKKAAPTAAESQTPEPTPDLRADAGVVITGDDAKDATHLVGLHKANKHYTLWVSPGPVPTNRKRNWNYLTILGQDLEEAKRKAIDIARRYMGGDKVGQAFYGNTKWDPQPGETVGLLDEVLTAAQLNPIDSPTYIGNKTLGMGKFPNVKIDDLPDVNMDYVDWLVNKTDRGFFRQAGDHLRNHPKYIEYAALKNLDADRIRAFEQRQAANRQPAKQDLSTENTTTDNKVVNRKVEKKKARKASEQIVDIVAPNASVPNVVPAALAKNMFPIQVAGANATIASLDGYGAALNGDGAGVGKTRQIVAVANHYAKQGVPVVIITENAAIGKPWEGNRKVPVLGGSMDKDSKAMGVSLSLLDTGEVVPAGSIKVTTYNRVEANQIPANAVVIFDESQNLANTFGDISKPAGEWKAKFSKIFTSVGKIAFYSATPADKPHQLAYLYKVLGYGSPQEYLNEALANGMVRRVRKFGKDEIPYYDVPKPQPLKKKLYGWVNQRILQAGKEGRAIKREISYEGTDVQFHDTKGTDTKKNPWAERFLEVMADLQGFASAGWILPAFESHVLYSAELAKIGDAVSMVQRELAAGRKAVLFFSRIREHTINGRKLEAGFGGERRLGDPVKLGTVDSPVVLLRAELERLGITYAELHGQSGTTSKTAQEKFAKDVDVLLASVESGGTGINLDDPTGKNPRTEIFMFAPYRGISTIQAMGRIWRSSTVQDDDKPNRYIFIVASDISQDAVRSAVLAKKLQLMNASLGGTAVSRLPMSKVGYSPDQLAGLELPDDGVESPLAADKQFAPGPLLPVKLNWSKTNDGRQYMARATADLLEWTERGGVEKSGLDIRVFKGRDGDWIALAPEPYEAARFEVKEDEKTTDPEPAENPEVNSTPEQAEAAEIVKTEKRKSGRKPVDRTAPDPADIDEEADQAARDGHYKYDPKKKKFQLTDKGESLAGADKTKAQSVVDRENARFRGFRNEAAERGRRVRQLSQEVRRSNASVLLGEEAIANILRKAKAGLMSRVGRNRWSIPSDEVEQISLAAVVRTLDSPAVQQEALAVQGDKTPEDVYTSWAITNAVQDAKTWIKENRGVEQVSLDENRDTTNIDPESLTRVVVTTDPDLVSEPEDPEIAAMARADIADMATAAARRLGEYSNNQTAKDYLAWILNPTRTGDAPAPKGSPERDAVFKAILDARLEMEANRGPSSRDGDETSPINSPEGSLIPKARYDAALKSLKSELGKLGITPQPAKDLWKNLIIVGAYHAEQGVRSFGHWSERMLSDLGDEVSEFLKRIYGHVKSLFRGVRTGFSKALEVASAKIPSGIMSQEDVREVVSRAGEAGKRVLRAQGRGSNYGPIESAKALVEKLGRQVIKEEEEFFKNVWAGLLQRTGRQLKLSSRNFREAAQRAASDIENFVRENPKYADYYKKDWELTRRILSDHYGRELSDGEFLLFRAVSGVTSPNTMLPSNMGDTVNLFNLWVQDGNFDAVEMAENENRNLVITKTPFKISGTASSNKARVVKIIGGLVESKGGIENAIKFLQEPVTKQELKAFNTQMGYRGPVGKIGAIERLVQQATGQSELIPRMFIFGPKVGAYTLNALGDSRYTTVDIWESRFIRSYFKGMFSENTGLPETDDEHETFSRFADIFKEEFEAKTGQTWDASALQAMRWFYIIDSARKAGYIRASTNETISFYTERKLRDSYGYRGLEPAAPASRGRGDGSAQEGDRRGQGAEATAGRTNLTPKDRGVVEQVESKRGSEERPLGYDPSSTAISRQTESSVLSLIRAEGLISSNDAVLHAGAGKTNNPDRSALEKLSPNVRHYDPGVPKDSSRQGLRERNFDKVVSPFVLNVLSAEDRSSAIQDIAASLKPEGTAFIGVRGATDVPRVSELNRKKTGWTPYSDGWLVPKNAWFTFQRGFTPQQLVAELEPYFGNVEIIRGGTAPVAVARDPRPVPTSGVARAGTTGTILRAESGSRRRRAEFSREIGKQAADNFVELVKKAFPGVTVVVDTTESEPIGVREDTGEMVVNPNEFARLFPTDLPTQKEIDSTLSYLLTHEVFHAAAISAMRNNPALDQQFNKVADYLFKGNRWKAVVRDYLWDRPDITDAELMDWLEENGTDYVVHEFLRMQAELASRNMTTEMARFLGASPGRDILDTIARYLMAIAEKAQAILRKAFNPALSEMVEAMLLEHDRLALPVAEDRINHIVALSEVDKHSDRMLLKAAARQRPTRNTEAFLNSRPFFTEASRRALEAMTYEGEVEQELWLEARDRLVDVMRSGNKGAEQALHEVLGSIRGDANLAVATQAVAADWFDWMSTEFKKRQTADSELASEYYGNMAARVRTDLAATFSNAGQTLWIASSILKGYKARDFDRQYTKHTKAEQARVLGEDEAAKEVEDEVEGAVDTAAEETVGKAGAIIEKLTEKARANTGKKTGLGKDQTDGLEKEIKKLEKMKSSKKAIDRQRVEDEVSKSVARAIVLAMSPEQAKAARTPFFETILKGTIQRMVKQQYDNLLDQQNITKEDPEVVRQKKQRRAMVGLIAEVQEMDIARAAFEATRDQLLEDYYNGKSKLNEEQIGMLEEMDYDATRLPNAIKYIKASINMRESVRQSLKAQRTNVNRLALELAELGDLTAEQAMTVARALQREYETAAKEEIKKAIDRLVTANDPEIRKAVKSKTAHDRLFEAANLGALRREAVWNAIAPNYGLPAYDPEFAREIEERAQKIQDLPKDSQQRNLETRLLMTDIANKQTNEAKGFPKLLRFIDTFIALWKAGILSGPPTQAVNFGFSHINALLSASAKAMALARMGKAVKSKEARSYLGYLSQLLMGTYSQLGRAKNEAANALNYGYSRFQNEKIESLGLLEGIKFDKNNPWKLSNLLAPAKYVGRFMQATDALNSSMASEMTQRAAVEAFILENNLSKEEAQNLRANVFDNSEEIRKQATAQANEEYARGDFGVHSKKAERLRDSRVEELIEREREKYVPGIIQKGRSEGERIAYNNPADRLIGFVMRGLFAPLNRTARVTQFLMPFPNTISNLLNTTIDYTPYGFLRARNLSLSDLFAKSGKLSDEFAPKEIKKGSFEYQEAISKAWMGTIGTAAVFALVLKGWMERDEEPDEEPFFEITAEGPSDLTAREQLRSTGWMPYTVKIGDLRLRYTDWPALNLMMGAFGTLTDGFVYNKQKDVEPLAAAISVFSTTLDRNMLSGLSDFFDIVNNPNQQGVNTLTRLSFGIVGGVTNPNLARWVRNTFAVDETGMVPRLEQRTFAGKLASLAPASGGYGEASLNVLAEPITRSPLSATTARFGTFGKESHPIITPLAEVGLFMSDPAYQVVFSVPKAGKIVDYKLTPEEQRDFTRIRGPILKKLLTPATVARLSSLARQDYDTAKEELQKVTMQATREAKAIYSRRKGWSR